MAPPVAVMSLIVALLALIVPEVCEMVAALPLAVALSVTDGLPVIANTPALLVVPDANLIVPARRVSVRVAPTVSASLNICVDPAALNVTGKSSVLLLKVCVTVALLAPNVKTVLPAAKVMPVESVRDPYILKLRFNKFTVEPVKLRLLTAPDKSRSPLPDTTSILSALAADRPVTVINLNAVPT